MSLSFGRGIDPCFAVWPGKQASLLAPNGSRAAALWQGLSCRTPRYPMDLLEYQGKQLFAKHGVPVPEGRHAATVDDAVAAANQVGFPNVVKAQVRTGKRGKAGGIKLAADRDEARRHAEAILGMEIGGLTVYEVWVERASDIASELYASIILDRSAKKLLALLSAMGGMDVEEIAARDPSALVRHHLEPGEALTAETGRELA